MIAFQPTTSLDSIDIIAPTTTPGQIGDPHAELELLLSALPAPVAAAVSRQGRLLEVVLDLGRQPELRYAGHTDRLCANLVSAADIDSVIAHLGAFGDDNRAGIDGTLHRISVMRNRVGAAIGLTCRVGRAVGGAADIIADLVLSGESVLLVGPPGIGKTTILRECARILSTHADRRVVIVDTSNEIAGDNNVPHCGVGYARRMQVSRTIAQHAVMIEAVENHMPQTIIVDEIGTELEASAARTIAERGVQLVATAHGCTLDNLLVNPQLNDLLGGVTTVTLGDETARERGCQKTVRERKAPTTFSVLVEIHAADRVSVHAPLDRVVDARLRGQPRQAEVRVQGPGGQILRQRQPGDTADGPTTELHIDVVGVGEPRPRKARKQERHAPPRRRGWAAAS